MTQKDRDDSLDALAQVVDGRPLSTRELAALREIIPYIAMLRKMARFWDAFGLVGQAVLYAAAMGAAVVMLMDQWRGK